MDKEGVNMYVVTGATGNIGHRIAEILLERGKKVRVVARTAEKLQPLASRGAEAFPGTLEDGKFLAGAFRDVKGVFAMIPPDMQTADFRAYQNRIGSAIVEAVKAAGVPFVVNLSSVGAHLDQGNGPVAGLYDQEQRLNKMAGANVVHLRPAFFMENLMMNIGLIREKGINGSPLRADLKFPMIATRDIARAAVDYLVAGRSSGKIIHELLGQRDVSMQEATAILGRAIGKPSLAYVQFPYDEAGKAMIGMGLSPDIVRLFIEMYRGFNEGTILRGIIRTAQNTTETSFETFAQEFAGVMKRAPAGVGFHSQGRAP